MKQSRAYLTTLILLNLTFGLVGTAHAGLPALPLSSLSGIGETSLPSRNKSVVTDATPTAAIPTGVRIPELDMSHAQATLPEQQVPTAIAATPRFASAPTLLPSTFYANPTTRPMAAFGAAPRPSHIVLAPEPSALPLFLAGLPLFTLYAIRRRRSHSSLSTLSASRNSPEEL